MILLKESQSSTIGFLLLFTEISNQCLIFLLHSLLFSLSFLFVSLSHFFFYRNILITADWQVKLCDFGLTRATSMSQMEGTLAKVRGTYTHCAPEVFKVGVDVCSSDF